MKLTIPRKIWLRGEANSKLLRSSDGKMCCVGIYLNALGVSRDDLRDMSSAHSLCLDSIPEEARWLLRTDSEMGCTGSNSAFELYSTNDIDPLSSKDREKKIKELFAQQGVEVIYE